MATPIYQFTQLPKGSAKSPVNARARRARAEGEAPSVGVIYNRLIPSEESPYGG